MVKRKGKRIDIYLSDKDYSNMIRLCEKHEISKSDFVRKAVNHFIKINAAADVRSECKEIGIKHGLNID